MNLLSNLFTSNRLPSSILLIGQDQSLKLNTALNFIKKNYNDILISGKIDRGSFLDLKILGKSGETIKIEEIRELINFLYLSPIESDKKFVIICNADRMNHNAANSLLKVLEEPPSNSHIFLIANSIEQLLPTISSRCLVVNFPPVQNAKEDPAQSKINRIISRVNINPNLADEFLGEYNNFVKLILNARELEVNNYIIKIAAKTGDKYWKFFCEIYLYFLHMILTGNADYMDEDEKKLHKVFGNIDCTDLYKQAINLFKEEQTVNLDRKSVALTLINKLFLKQPARI